MPQFFQMLMIMAYLHIERWYFWFNCCTSATISLWEFFIAPLLCHLAIWCSKRPTCTWSIKVFLVIMEEFISVQMVICSFKETIISLTFVDTSFSISRNHFLGKNLLAASNLDCENLNYMSNRILAYFYKTWLVAII